jgi:hypothetical protein
VCVASVGGTDSYRPQISKGNFYAIALEQAILKELTSKTGINFPVFHDVTIRFLKISLILRRHVMSQLPLF